MRRILARSTLPCLLLLLAAPALPLSAQSLTTRERAIQSAVEKQRDDAINFLERVVNMPSGTLNTPGVRAVGEVFRAELDALGFETRWVDMPAGMRRAGHLVAERKGTRGKRILLLGHLDTVFEGEGQRFERTDSVARGAGTSDMKGGDVAMLFALKAMHAAGALDGARITVVLTGDEESPGEPLSEARRVLIDAAQHADLALSFEGGSREQATIARRGASFWLLKTTGRQGHSSQIFSQASGLFAQAPGYGAVFELARILDEFRRALAGEQYLTFNPGLALGGAEVQYQPDSTRGQVSGKLNIIAPTATAHGDLRFISEEQKERARARMRQIVLHSLPGTSATIEFFDAYPAMSPTAGNAALLAQLDATSVALGLGNVKAMDAGSRGAGDASFVAPFIDTLDGLGVAGAGAHSPSESVRLPSLALASLRAAVLMHRLASGETGRMVQ
ncbi:MAG: M20/M25/M40 family metallo-hydrolase [Gemmatimonadaceae bacterium]